ncbi:hypothetical protein PF007_g32104 [Phytophthora fragariae]|uniref:Uncharacterized protein n=1 Tax=Phytophthora fragariae TaxID=53985 RepID=A0A6A3PGV5_9STRA|nr:hypothetical protein PF011_g31982 [Phytophthora fragariae]KAE9056081.1 hypothetical protein PF007_g32104 [Phytophthora fragariae]KAE9063552.1 hypothetical protein PF006_g30918 [Phytophthora fragariae]KAE9158309.1 hypothetical protein PF004_g31920 [Phytophthora fragariae]KAE9265407.1 hypothetical protein PF001_g30901 [Phytophthora fragariae]
MASRFLGAITLPTCFKVAVSSLQLLESSSVGTTPTHTFWPLILFYPFDGCIPLISLAYYATLLLSNSPLHWMETFGESTL